MVKSDFLCLYGDLCVWTVIHIALVVNLHLVLPHFWFLVQSIGVTDYTFGCYSKNYSENSELFLWNSNILQQNLGHSVVQSPLYLQQITEFHKLLPLSTSAYCAASNAFFPVMLRHQHYCVHFNRLQLPVQQHSTDLSSVTSVDILICSDTHTHTHSHTHQYSKSIQHFYFLIFFTLWEIWKSEPAHQGILRYLKHDWVTVYSVFRFLLLYLFMLVFL